MDINNESEIFVHLSGLVNGVRLGWLEFEYKKNVDAFLSLVKKYFVDVQKRFKTKYTLYIYRKDRGTRPKLILFSITDLSRYGQYLWDDDSLANILNLRCEMPKENKCPIHLLCNGLSIITAVCPKSNAANTIHDFQIMKTKFTKILPEYTFSVDSC